MFKRKAYDSNFFYRLFGTNADQVYKIVYINDPSAYTLQQWALYKMRCSRYEEAFIDINKALRNDYIKFYNYDDFRERDFTLSF